MPCHTRFDPVIRPRKATITASPFLYTNLSALRTEIRTSHFPGDYVPRSSFHGYCHFLFLVRKNLKEPANPEGVEFQTRHMFKKRSM
jgi:hypothetical protein